MDLGGALVGIERPSLDGDRGDLRRGRTAWRRGAGDDANGHFARRTEKAGNQTGRRIVGLLVLGVALRFPVELAGEPRNQPDRQAGRSGWIGRNRLDDDRLDPFELFALTRAIEELCNQLTPASQAEPDAVAAASAMSRVEAQPKGTDFRAGVAEVEDHSRADAGQVVKE